MNVWRFRVHLPEAVPAGLKHGQKNGMELTEAEFEKCKREFTEYMRGRKEA